VSSGERDRRPVLAALQSLSPYRWSVWRIPAPLVMSVLVVECTAVLLVTAGLAGVRPSLATLFTFGLLSVAGVVHGEVGRRIEQVRRQVGVGDLHVNLGSIWFFAAAVLLAPAWAGLCAAIVHTHLWLRSAGRRTPLYRQVFSTATFVLSGFATSAAMAFVGGFDRRFGEPVIPTIWVLGLGVLVFLTVNSALVAGAIAVSDPQAEVGQILGGWDDNLLEIATLCLGALVAVAVSITPWLLLFVLPPLLVLHRAVLVRHLEAAAATDGKTGLLTAAAWHTRAERELRRRGDAPCGVLVLDLDHFKAVNDTHGHLAGDHVLAAVAAAVQSEVRERDLVGRFGGEEYVVFLAGRGEGADTDLAAVAERIRLRVAGLRVEIPTADGPLTIDQLSVSVGGAVHRNGVGELRELLQIADTALYAAKRAGRNMVRMETAAGGGPPAHLPPLLTVSDNPSQTPPR
jgi:diguanylate cyclase (GGDEF)-like protein